MAASACTVESPQGAVKRLFPLSEEVIIGRVWHERLVAHISGDRATVLRSGSSFRVQALDECGFAQNRAARRPVLRTN